MQTICFEHLLTRPPGAEQALRLTIIAGWVLTMESSISSSIVESSTCSSPLCRAENKEVRPPSSASPSLFCRFSPSPAPLPPCSAAWEALSA